MLTLPYLRYHPGSGLKCFDIAGEAAGLSLAALGRLPRRPRGGQHQQDRRQRGEHPHPSCHWILVPSIITRQWRNHWLQVAVATVLRSVWCPVTAPWWTVICNSTRLCGPGGAGRLAAAARAQNRSCAVELPGAAGLGGRSRWSDPAAHQPNLPPITTPLTNLPTIKPTRTTSTGTLSLSLFKKAARGGGRPGGGGGSGHWSDARLDRLLACRKSYQRTANSFRLMLS